MFDNGNKERVEKKKRAGDLTTCYVPALSGPLIEQFLVIGANPSHVEGSPFPDTTASFKSLPMCMCLLMVGGVVAQLYQ